ncbi:putative dehydrogenase [Bradyrhizobium sp. USDA 241]
MASERIGIVGLGTIGKAHWKVIRESSETTLVAISDPTPSALEFARAEAVPAYADYRDMLEKEKLDGVVVAVPNAQHVPVSLACIERGIPVLVEKPVADEVEAAREMCRAAEARNVPVLVGHHRRHSTAVQRVRQAIRDGLIGRPVTATVMYNQLKTASYFDLDWRRQAGGGPILINLIHEIDLIRFIFGEIRSLQALSSNAVRGFAVEDTAAVLLQFHSGAIATISVSDTAVTPVLVGSGLGRIRSDARNFGPDEAAEGQFACICRDGRLRDASDAPVLQLSRHGRARLAERSQCRDADG